MQATDSAAAQPESGSDDAVIADPAAVAGDATVAAAESASESEAAAATESTEATAQPEAADEDSPVSRRARRAQSSTADGAAQGDTAATQPAAGVEDRALEQRYKAADLNGKREILMGYWRDEFPKRMIIPVKPEKLSALESMVRSILDACPDEYALVERWDKIEQLLERYSSAVVAEYGYKSLLSTVQAEEQQRMYGRPKDAQPAGEAAPVTPRAVANRPAADASGESASARPAAPERRSVPRMPAQRSGDETDDDVDARDGEYIDGESRPKRDVRREYEDYNFDDTSRRRGVSGLLERVHRSGGEHAEGAGAKGWLKQIFRRGDVLDYSSDEPEARDAGDELESERMESRREERRPADGYAAKSGSERDYARTDYRRGADSASDERQRSATPARDEYKRTDYQRSAAPARDDYERTDYQRSATPARDDYERTDYQRSATPARDEYGRTDYQRSAAPARDEYERTDYQRSAAPVRDAYAHADYQREAQPYDRGAGATDDYRPPLDRSVYDRNNADYSEDRPDYSQDYADNDYMPGVQDDYARGGYAQGGYAGDGYVRGGYSSGYADDGYSRTASYDAYNARPNPAGDARREYGEREYRTRPQSGERMRGGEDAEDRWRRCTPTKDDRGGMGAPHGDTYDKRNPAPAGRVRRGARCLLGALSAVAFAAAYAEGDGPEDAPDGSDAPPRVAARRRARLELGGRMRGSRRRWLLLLGALALLSAAMGAAYGLRVVYDVRQYEGEFYEGIYLDGVALAGMTPQEAAQAVNAANVERIESITLTVSYGDESYELDSAGLGVELDTRAKLDELWKLGREGGYAQRHRQITQLRESGVNEYTSFSYSRTALDEFLSGIKAEVDLAPRDAQIAFHPNAADKFDITPSATGREVDITALSADARAALAEGGGEVELAPRRLEPGFTTDEARACTVKLVTYSTQIRSSNSARTSNIKLALGFYNGLTVQPGEQVDFNKLVGNRTEARGFKPAPEYSNGEIVEGIGGGVCQASTTLYGALLRAGMRIDERYNHSMTVGYVPLSQDAAVVYPGKSLTFTNTTGYPAFFVTSVTSEKATVTIYGYDVYPGRSVSIVSETLSVDKAQVNTYADPNYQYTTEPGQEVMVTTPSDGVTSRAYRVLTDDATGK